MAKIVHIQSLGGPDVLQIEDVDVRPPAAGEVRIRVEAIGLNRVELLYRAGLYGALQLPAPIGYEAAGVIESVGSDVSDYAVGDRVAILPGMPMDKYGTYGELILAPANILVRSPTHQSSPEAAATWMQYLTAYAILIDTNLRQGDAVLITAASSSVGIAAIQIANAVGAVPIAITRGPGKVDRLRSLGAAHVIVSDEENVPDAVLKATRGDGAALLFDAVAGEGLTALLQVLRPRGSAIIYGTFGGGPSEMPIGLMLGNNLTVRGYTANQVVDDPLLRAQAVDFITANLASGALKPVIDRSFPLSDIANAHRYLESNEQLGKVIVNV